MASSSQPEDSALRRSGSIEESARYKAQREAGKQPQVGGKQQPASSRRSTLEQLGLQVGQPQVGGALELEPAAGVKDAQSQSSTRSHRRLPAVSFKVLRPRHFLPQVMMVTSSLIASLVSRNLTPALSTALQLQPRHRLHVPPRPQPRRR